MPSEPAVETTPGTSEVVATIQHAATWARGADGDSRALGAVRSAPTWSHRPWGRVRATKSRVQFGQSQVVRVRRISTV